MNKFTADKLSESPLKGNISCICAMGKNRVISRNNKIPWHLPADLKRFKELTLNKPVIMGRKTFDSIGHPLENRINIVISRNPNLSIPGCEVFFSINEAFKSVEEYPEIMVIGGEQIFEKILPLTSTIYLTIIHQDFPGDKFFPAINSCKWHEIDHINFQPDEKNPFYYSFITLKRPR